MNSAIERLVSLRVADIMNRDVVSVSADSTMAEAAEMLHSHNVSGAPVVDEHGHCVGVLSVADFATPQKCQDEPGQLPFRGDEFQVVSDVASEPWHIEYVATDYVRQHMAPAVQTIDERASMVEAARSMSAAHVHRLIVLDEKSHPLGVVSSLDVVAAVVGAIDE